MRRRDLGIAVILVAAFALLAAPFQLESTFWGDAPVAWALSLVAGLALALYITYTFLRALRRLLGDAESRPPEVDR